MIVFAYHLRIASISFCLGDNEMTSFRCYSPAVLFHIGVKRWLLKDDLLFIILQFLIQIKVNSIFKTYFVFIIFASREKLMVIIYLYVNFTVAYINVSCLL